MNYLEFLRGKIELAPVSGFDVRPEELNPALKPHQRDAVMWAVRGGRRALFESFGLGKTVQELEWCRLVTEHEGGKALIVLPLGVRQEFTRDAVNRMRTLNTTQSQRRQQMHVCPLQLDIVDRLINRYTNPGDLVLDPFGGLGTVALQAMKAGRRGYTIELNDGYFRDAVGYLKGFEETDDNFSLFDFMQEA